MSLLKIRRAIISVSDKTGITEFAQKLTLWNIEIISTGGTLATLKKAGIPAISISEITGFPEILDGRVKTLHPNIHAGLLARNDDPAHRRQLEELKITPIDMVVINLYPFESTISDKNVTLGNAIEQIDIGGPAMLRASAKNFLYKVVISNPDQYAQIIAELEKNNGSISDDTRFHLAQTVFQRTAQYDTAISNYLALQHPRSADVLPSSYSFSFTKSEDLRYGENPHQKAALYGDFYSYVQKLHGKEISYNNIVDIQAAIELAEEFSEPTVVIIKHTNPCGVGSSASLAEAYQKAYATDTKSAFGGIIALNRPIDMDTALLIDKIFTEVVIAPEFPPDILAIMKKKKDRRLMKQLRQVSGSYKLSAKPVAGGLLVQTVNNILTDTERMKIVTKRTPTDNERASMMFGWRVAKHVKSNAIVYTHADRTIGVGAGQMSRVDSARIAVMKAKEAGLELAGTTAASDAYFPFADGLLEVVKAGATAVIQPGGSVRDEEVIRAADENNISMIFTGIRHFKH
jgi:phosphoribosylaminoimidazolecarboxamide formyltransferase/IMP cyclohydrolase